MIERILFVPVVVPAGSTITASGLKERTRVVLVEVRVPS